MRLIDDSGLSQSVTFRILVSLFLSNQDYLNIMFNQWI